MKNLATINLWRRSFAACIKPPRRLFSRQMVLIGCVGICAWACTIAASAAESRKSNSNQPPSEAPSGFDDLSNGFEEQQAFDKDRKTFEEVETILPVEPDRKSTRLNS